MQGERVSEFITNWHKALEVWKPSLKNELSNLAQQLIETIQSDHVLQDLATTPLLLSALCAIHKDRRSNLPKNRTDLYEKLVAMLLDRDKERKIPNPVDIDTTLYYLKKLSLWLVRAEEAQGSKNAVMDFLRNHPRPGVTATAENVYKSLVERSGIAREPIENKVDYIHRTLQEYLAAFEVVSSEGNAAELVKNSERDYWTRVIEFSGGISGKNHGAFQASLVEGLYKKGKYLQALECVRGAIADNSKDIVSECAKEAIHRLFRQEDVYIISAAGSLALAHLNYDSSRGGWHLGLRVHILSQIPDSYNILLSYQGSQKLGVIRALLQWSGPVFGQERIIKDFIQQLSPEKVELSNSKTLDGLEFLPLLKHLEVFSPSLDMDLSPLGTLKHLESLDLSGTFNVSSLTILSHLPKLTKLRLVNVPDKFELSFLSQLPQLQSLDLSYVHRNEDLNVISRLPNLQSLTINNISESANLSLLTKSKNLSDLTIYHVSDKLNLEFLSQFTKLDSLTLMILGSNENLSFLSQLTNLRNLSLYSLPKHFDMKLISDLENLERVTLYNSFKEFGPDFVPQFKKLKQLGLARFSSSFISMFLSKHNQISDFALLGSRDFYDPEILFQFTNLRSLILYDVEVSHLDFLPTLKELKSLTLADLKNISDWRVLSQLTQLENLTLSISHISNDLDFISHLPNLERFETIL